MKFEEIKKAIMRLSTEDRLHLMREVGTEWCEAMMSNPDAMAQMMPQCREMMARMREMMSGMCRPEGQTGGKQ